MLSIWVIAPKSTRQFLSDGIMVGILASFIKNSSHYLKIIILLFVISQSRLAVRFSVKCEYYIRIV